jgi:hypothetical protein
MTEQTKSDLISKIIKLELQITKSIIGGHKPSVNDQFQEMRSELNTLRCLVFGYESNYCKKNL